MLDADFGPGFIKLCTCFPYPAKVWANGHEWAKRQADRAGVGYTTNQMTYDLRRLRLHGLIERVPKTNTYVLTPEGLRVAVFYTKLHGRLPRPLVAAADQPPSPVELRRALATIDRVIGDYVDNARLGSAA